MSDNQERNNVEYVPTTPSNYNPYVPRFVSYFTLGFAAIALLSCAIAILVTLINDLVPIQSIVDLVSPVTPYIPFLFATAVVTLLLAIGSEVYSRLKTPPAAWRVKNELVRTLSQYGLLDTNNTDTWKGMFAVSPIGKYDKNAKMFTLPFLLRHANAKERFEQIGDSISGFARCLSAEVLEDNSKRLYNCKLVLWYTDNPYGEVDLENLFDE